MRCLAGWDPGLGWEFGLERALFYVSDGNGLEVKRMTYQLVVGLEQLAVGPAAAGLG